MVLRETGRRTADFRAVFAHIHHITSDCIGVGLLVEMHLHVSLNLTLAVKPFAAVVADTRLLPGVCLLMTAEVKLLLEPHAAHVALERAIVVVRGEVALEHTELGKLHVADTALVPLLFFIGRRAGNGAGYASPVWLLGQVVTLHVFFEMMRLRKRSITGSALEGLFPRVNQIVPLQ